MMIASNPCALKGFVRVHERGNEVVVLCEAVIGFEVNADAGQGVARFDDLYGNADFTKFEA